VWRIVDRMFIEATEEINCTSHEDEAKKINTVG
jgi:hypothetical protein